MPETAQDRGRQWDYELAGLIGGTRQRGSGNRPYAKLDAGNGQLVVSGKHVDGDSVRLTRGMIDEAVRAVLGPEAPHYGSQSFVAVHFGLDVTSIAGAVGIVDLGQLLTWIKAPPALIQATPQESLRATARTPPLFRRSSSS